MFSCLVLWSTLQVTRSKILSKMWTWDSPGADLWINMVLLTDLGCNFKYDQTFPQWSSTFVILHMKGKPMVFWVITFHQGTIIIMVKAANYFPLIFQSVHWQWFIEASYILDLFVYHPPSLWVEVVNTWQFSLSISFIITHQLNKSKQNTQLKTCLWLVD